MKRSLKFSVSNSGSDGVGMKALATGFLLLISMVSLVAAADTAPPTSSDNWTATGFVSESSVLVELAASDTDSSVANISYRVNGGNWSTVSGNSTLVTVDTQGNNTLEYNATDSEGNNESVNTEYVALDSVSPKFLDQNDINVNPVQPNPVTDSQPVIELYGVSDDVTSVDESTINVSFRNNSGSLVTSIEDTSSAGLTFDSGYSPARLIYNLTAAGDSLEEGSYNISVSGSDTVGNFGQAYSQDSYIVDKTSPIWKNLRTSATNPELTYSPGSDVELYVDAADNLSGVGSVDFYANDSGSFQQINGGSGGGGRGGR